MAVSARQIDCWGWEAIELSGKRVSLVITPEIGGRIISLKLDGVEAFFSLPELRGKRFSAQDVEDVRARKKALGWLHYGGYKTWLAPQPRWTEGLPFLDLDSGCYEYEIGGSRVSPVVRLRSPVCRETGIRFTRAISLDEAGKITVDQEMTNAWSKEAEWGLWDVTQVCGPGRAVLPVNPASRFPGGVKVYPAESSSLDVMDRHVAREGDLAFVSCRKIERFKYGTDSIEGWMLGLLDKGAERSLAYLKTFTPDPSGIYPHEAVVEVYNSGALPYFEMEAHSPLQRLLPGAAYRYIETWFLDWLPKNISAEEIRRWIKSLDPDLRSVV